MNKPLRANPPSARPVTGGHVQNDRWVRDDRWSLFTAAMVWLLIIYLVIPNSYWTGDAPSDTATEMARVSVVARAIKIGLIAISSLVVLWRSSLAVLLVRTLNPFFLIFLGLVPLSILWSIDQAATSARYVSILSIVLTSFAFVLVGWHRARFQNVVRPVVTLLLAASLVFGILHPELAIEAGETGSLKNSWHGLASQKNQFGELASFGVLFWLHASLFKEAKWQITLPCSGIAWTCVLLSRSSTSLLASALSTVFMLLMVSVPVNLRRYMPYFIGSFALIVMTYALAVLNLIPGIGVILEPIALLTGKDLTFSGRGAIWDIIKEHIQTVPWLGSGYGAYWTGTSLASPSYGIFMAKMYFYPSEAHNGYLEMVNDLGFVGLACLLCYLLVWVRQSLRLLKVDRAQAALFLAIFFQQAVTNLSESTWLAINSAFAIAVVTLATFAMARALLDQRLTQRFGNRGASP
jgi:exopolysaccharide production protein ExoQ